MSTYTEVLPPSKTQPNRCIKYTPACAGVGVLQYEDAQTTDRYAVTRQPFGGVRLTKADGETYVVSPAACECKGFVFSGRACKHISAVHAIIGNGWLDADDRETVGDRHERADEYDGWVDTWERDRTPGGVKADTLGRKVVCEFGGA